MMGDLTARDRAWLQVIDRLRSGVDTTTRSVADDADVSMDVAREVLHAAEDAGLYSRETDRDHIYRVDIGPLAEVQDDSYRRYIRDIIAESPE